MISPYTRNQAKKFGVQVRPSKKAGKKIDVFRGDNYIGSAGAKGMGDFGIYLEKGDRKFAEERRRLYRARASEGKKDSPSWLAWNLLW
jgi:hypothetical protein